MRVLIPPQSGGGDPLLNFGTPFISWERLKLETFFAHHRIIINVIIIRVQRLTWH